jgi:hypothetical protein
MLTNREKHKYGKAIDKKLESVGVEDKILLRVVKILKIHNPAYKPGDDKTPMGDPKANPEYFQLPRYQAINLRRSIIKRLLRTDDKKAIEIFLKSDLSALKNQSDSIKEEVNAK